MQVFAKAREFGMCSPYTSLQVFNCLEVGIRVVEPAALLLRSTDVETQLEGQLLLQEVAKDADSREAVLIALITLLNPTAIEGQHLPLPLSLQQSSSAK